jgi:hypothetical protein
MGIPACPRILGVNDLCPHRQADSVWQDFDESIVVDHRFRKAVAACKSSAGIFRLAEGLERIISINHH